MTKNIHDTKHKILKYYPHQLTIKSFKNKIFNGEILIIKKTKEIDNIIKLTETYFHNILDNKVINFLNIHNNLNSDNDTDRLFKLLQNRVKLCGRIKKIFGSFLIKIGFKTEKTFADLVTLRFSPGKNKQSIGTLKPSKAHRDTWASNLMNQINFWFPIHNVTKQNSIYLVTDYFKKKIKNNSENWNFDDFKKKKNYPSVPTSNILISPLDKTSFRLSKGEVLCFSGHHLHGSTIGIKNRINLETRIVNRHDENFFNLPVNIDSEYKEKKNNWFKNLETGENY